MDGRRERTSAPTVPASDGPGPVWGHGDKPTELLLHRIVRDSPGGIAAIGLDHVFLTANPAFCTRAAGDGVVLAGTDGDGLLEPSFLKALRRCLAECANDREVATLSWEHPAPVGCVVEYAVSVARDRAGAAQFYVVIGTDVTEQRRLDDERRQAEKLESLGRFAGGAAHDFNNLLLGMIGQAELAMMDLAPDHPAREAMSEIVKVGFRAADLCKQLLTYCGKGEHKLAPLNLATTVRALAPLLESRLGGVPLVLDLAADLPDVNGDEVQLRQVLLDLVANAAEAVGRRGQGRITVSAGAWHCDTGDLKDAATGRELGPGRFVRLAVHDDGPGMTSAQLARMFDPFYSTNPAGRGLGLASVMGVVRGHGGAVTATSEVGRGTTVRVDLPVAPTPTPAPAATATNGDGFSPVARTHAARILVVDDEAPVRKVASKLLEAAGYRVTTSANGYDALDLFGSAPDSFDLVLLDMTMPGISGLEALERIRQFRSQLPVLLTSGFNQDDVHEVLARDVACGFIQKPYAAGALHRRIAEMLG